MVHIPKTAKKTHIWNNNSLIKCYKDESDESADFDCYLDIWDICLNIIITEFFLFYSCVSVVSNSVAIPWAQTWLCAAKLANAFINAIFQS